MQVKLASSITLNPNSPPNTAKSDLVIVIDDEGASLLDSSPVAHLALASTEALRLVDLLNVSPGLNISPEEADSLLGLSEALDLVCHDKGNLRDVVDAVTF
jgi:hypothetical protein